jgi:hypothetical protein
LIDANHAQLAGVLQTHGERTGLLIRGHDFETSIALERRPSPGHFILPPDAKIAACGGAEQHDACQANQSARQSPLRGPLRTLVCNISSHGEVSFELPSLSRTGPRK